MSDNLIASARLGRTHGVRGYMRLDSFSGLYEHFEKLDECVIQTKENKRIKLEIEDIAYHADSVLIKFKGVDTPEKARLLSQSVLYVDRSKAAPLEEGEYYIADLFGLDVVFEGRIVGKVESVSEGSQALLLNVRTEDGKIHLIPNLEVFVRRPDFEKKEIELLNKELLS